MSDADAYARLKRRVAVAHLGLTLAFLGTLCAAGAARWWSTWLSGVTPWVWQVTFYVAGLAVPVTAALAPLDWYRGFVLEHQYGFSRESLGRWAWRWLKMQGVGGLMLLAMAVAVAWLLRVAPASWWFWAALLVIAWSVVLTQWMPVVLLPMFYRQRPLANTVLGERLQRLASACGARVRGVYEIDFGKESSKANACLCGLGITRRILLTDTMTQAYAPEEIEAVLAHELGHHRLRHLTQLLGISAVSTLVTFWLAGHWLRAGGRSGVNDLAALPAIAFALGVLHTLLTPVHNGVARRFERAADRFALEATRAPRAFIAAMQKLQRQNLAEANPSRWVEWWWYDHPPIAKRVAMAEAFEGAG